MSRIVEQFWVDLCLQNPLNTDVSLNEVTLIIEEVGKNEVSLETYLEIETIDEVAMSPGEKRVVCFLFKYGVYNED
jgi:trafficking protein particle complex subunit 8